MDASPGVTYSVSFCDSTNTEDDRQLLLPDDEIGRPPRSASMDIPDVPGGHCPCCSRSLPENFHSTRGISIPGGLGYGSLPDNLKQGQTQKVIYCVHGKPGGCCATIVSGGPVPGGSITIVDEHCHQERGNTVDKHARRKLITASILCLVFMIAECVGGYLSGSLAIATDAAHLLTDFASFMISLFALWVAQRKPSRTMPFGWYRAEVIGALTSVLTIWVVTGVLVYLAAERIIHKQFEIDAFVMLITSGIGVLVNFIMGLTLHQHGPKHNHSHEGGNSGAGAVSVDAPVVGVQPAIKPRKNINVRAAFIHVIGDLLQSVGVFIAACIIYYKPDWKIVDPICTFLFSVLVLMTTFAIIKDTLLVLMEGIPKDVDFNEVLNTFMGIDGVVRVHNLRIWALSLDKTALSAHLAISPNVSSSDILKIASRKIHSRFNFFEMTLQIENFQPNMENCDQCKVPPS